MALLEYLSLTQLRAQRGIQLCAPVYLAIFQEGVGWFIEAQRQVGELSCRPMSKHTTAPSARHSDGGELRSYSRYLEYGNKFSRSTVYSDPRHPYSV